MKKFTLGFLFLFSVNLCFSQVNLVVEAPLNSSSSNTNRAPNGTAAHAFHRGCFLVLQSELINIPSGTNITSFGYTINSAATGAGPTMPVAGNCTVYLQNTTNLTYQKGTVFSTALTGMTPVFANILTIPAVGATSVVVTLSTPFPYTGGGMYVACDWASAGPFSTTGAFFWGETAVFPLPAGGGAVAYSQLSAPTTLTLTAARPSFLFGFTNSNTNDIQVITIEAMGKVCAPFNTPHTIKAYVKNISTITKTSIGVNLNVTGANPFSNPQTISSLAPGVGTWVTFSTFNPQILGTNIMSVSVASDQNNLNNSATHTQVVTCDQWSQSPPAGNYTVNTLGFASPVTGLIVATFPNPVASTMTGLRLAVGGATTAVGQPLYGVLTDASGVLLASTNVITITNGMLGTFLNFSFASPQSLAANTTYYIGYSQSVAGASFAGAFNSYIPVSYIISYNNTITGGPLFVNPGNFGYLGIEAVFGPFASNLSIVSTPSAVCIGACLSLAAPLGLSNYTWSTGSTGPSLNDCPGFVNSYSVAGTNTLGCPASASISILVNPLPNVAIASATNAICIGNPISFTATGATNYSLNNVATPPAIIQTPLTNTGYTITGIDANGCVNTASIGISVFSLTVTISPDMAICKGKTATLTASPSSYNYNWLTGSGSIPFQNPTVTPSVTTTYTAIATDVNGCSQSNMVTITVNPNPTVTATTSKSVSCKGQPVTLTASGAATYTWNGTPGPAALTVTLTANATYNLIGATSAGCTHSIILLQVVNPCTTLEEGKITNSRFTIFPNPNNGIFNINCEGFEAGRFVEIYNTLGALVKQVELNAENTTIDLGDESPGIYLLQISDQMGKIQVSKIIKQ